MSKNGEKSSANPPVNFPELSESELKSGKNSSSQDLGMLMDVPVMVSLEVGRTKISIKRLLELNQGSVIALDKNAGDPIDVLVNGKLIGHGEVVVIDDKFGLKFTDLVNIEKPL